MKLPFLTAALVALLLLPQGAVKSQERTNVINTALRYLNRPYVAQTLETPGRERLIIDTLKVDCTTFVEYVLAEALASDSRTFQENLQRIRYRDGKIDGYCSRLHYIADWVINGRRAGFLQDICQTCSNDSLPIQLNYMSTHLASYPKLASSEENQRRIKQHEQRLNKGYFHYLPKNKISESGPKWIQDGDILAITTSISGLDVSHLGFAIHQNGKLYLLHASSASGKVEISKEPISRLMLKNRRWTGLRVLRAVTEK